MEPGRNPLPGIFGASLEQVRPATQSRLYTELGKLTEAELVEVVAAEPGE